LTTLVTIPVKWFRVESLAAISGSELS